MRVKRPGYTYTVPDARVGAGMTWNDAFKMTMASTGDRFWISNGTAGCWRRRRSPSHRSHSDSSLGPTETGRRTHHHAAATDAILRHKRRRALFSLPVVCSPAFVG